MKNVNLQAFKDLHRGERAYIIGNGPSVQDIDLNVLNGSVTFAMNRISLLYEKTNWRPTYYIYCSTNISDSRWGRSWKSSVVAAATDPATTAFIGREFEGQLGLGKEEVIWLDNITETRPDHDGELPAHTFSIDAIDRLDKSGSSISLAYQLAYLMGFREIILLGCDLGWTTNFGSKKDQNHFSEKYRAFIPDAFKANMQMRSVHELAKQAFGNKSQPVHIYNASTRTVLDSFPIINFHELINSGIYNFDEDRMRLAVEYWAQLQSVRDSKQRHLNRLFGQFLKKIEKIKKKLALNL